MSRNRPKPVETPAESAAERLARYRAFIEKMGSSPEYRAEVAMLDFTCELSRAMSAQGVSRAELARRIGTSPAYITKVLRGDANLTLASMVKLARAVGRELHLQLAETGAAACSVDTHSGKPDEESLDTAGARQPAAGSEQPSPSRQRPAGKELRAADPAARYGR